MADREKLRNLSRSVQIPPTIKEKEKVPESSSASTLSLSNSGALSQSYKTTPPLALNTIFPDFVYLQQLLLRFRYTERATRGVYRAAVTEDSPCQLDHRELIVKIVPAESGYGETAHQLMAQWGRAPRLYGIERIAGDRLAVVMEDLSMRPGDDEAVAPLPRSQLTAEHQLSESRLIGLLHNAGFVHGDLRDPSFVCSEVGGDVWLAGFDWAARVGNGRYPADLDEREAWPAGVACGGVITKEHDWGWHRLRYAHLRLQDKAAAANDGVDNIGLREIKAEFTLLDRLRQCVPFVVSSP